MERLSSPLEMWEINLKFAVSWKLADSVRLFGVNLIDNCLFQRYLVYRVTSVEHLTVGPVASLGERGGADRPGDTRMMSGNGSCGVVTRRPVKNTL